VFQYQFSGGLFEFLACRAFAAFKAGKLCHVFNTDACSILTICGN
jgi:hypothetical protein